MNKNIDISENFKFFKGDLKNKKFIDSVFEIAIKEKKPIEGVNISLGLKQFQNQFQNLCFIGKTTL